MDGDTSPAATAFSSGLLDSILDLVLVFETTGDLVHWNRPLTAVTGYTDDTLSSLSTDRLFADSDTVRDAIAAVDAMGQTTFDATVLTADGDRLVYEFTATSHEPNTDTDSVCDEPVVVCVGRDVAQPRRRERQFARYETILDSLPDAVYAITPDGTLEYVNEQYAAMKGVTREELVGTDIDSWVSDDTVERADKLRTELANGERTAATIEYEFVTSDGERFPAELRFAAVDDGLSDIGRVGMIRDVTERAERERQLQRQNERLDEFATIVSHDLRNPLNIAEGRLDLARAEHDTDNLEAVAVAHARMRSLIDDLLALARHGQSELELTTVSLSSAAERCWHTIERPGAALVVETDAAIRADESQLRRLFENLFRNAVEHAGDEVTVTLGELPDGFFVADDGPGIPTDVRDQVFEAGYSTNSEGTGLGLSIVQEIADAHGWGVHVVDDENGARFEIRDVTVA